MSRPVSALLVGASGRLLAARAAATPAAAAAAAGADAPVLLSSRLSTAACRGQGSQKHLASIAAAAALCSGSGRTPCGISSTTTSGHTPVRLGSSNSWVSSSTAGISSSAWACNLSPLQASSSGSSSTPSTTTSSTASSSGKRRGRADAADAAAAAVTANASPLTKPTGICNRKSLPMGWKKLEFVLPLARRRRVDDALAQLGACPKRAALAVRHAIANARNNAIVAGADPARLVVERIWTGRATPFKKPWFHGRGYHSIRQRRRTNLTVVVSEAPLQRTARRGRLAPARLLQPAMLRPRRERRYPRPWQLQQQLQQQQVAAA